MVCIISQNESAMKPRSNMSTCHQENCASSLEIRGALDTAHRLFLERAVNVRREGSSGGCVLKKSNNKQGK